jgi:hypothetical protein
MRRLSCVAGKAVYWRGRGGHGHEPARNGTFVLPEDQRQPSPWSHPTIWLRCRSRLRHDARSGQRRVSSSAFQGWSGRSIRSSMSRSERNPGLSLCELAPCGEYVCAGCWVLRVSGWSGAMTRSCARTCRYPASASAGRQFELAPTTRVGQTARGRRRRPVISSTRIAFSSIQTSSTPTWLALARSSMLFGTGPGMTSIS